MTFPEEFIPENILEKEKLLPLEKALKDIHFPESVEDTDTARNRFAFEDLFLLELKLLGERKKLKEKSAFSLDASIEEIKKLLGTLPFGLTDSQKQVLWEVVQDLEIPHPMNRLLQGDVGSGKTIIAGLIAILTARRGFETVIMAPTEILARQHYETILKFFPEHDEGIALLTGRESRLSYGSGLETEKKKADLVHDIENGKVKIVIGTHAVISGKNEIAFPSLALVVIDEQHRFGIRQRAKLLEDREHTPHFLSMSATPIPRTLSLTIFSDLDLSRITELPKNRKGVVTRVVPPNGRKKAYEFVRSEVQKGRQVFVVCPRIEPPEEIITETEVRKLEIKSVKDEYEKLSTKIFPDLQVAMLHGKQKSEEKEKIMRGLSENKIHVLVSTSVIEVGVDVPNATVMMIEGAERFGLAQLYQFRGRVGRGSHQSYCFLFADSDSEKIRERLLSIVEAKNGLELAERDLALRGPGEFLGRIQTGKADLAMKALQNPEIAVEAKKHASEILEAGIQDFPLLQERLKAFTERLHRE